MQTNLFLYFFLGVFFLTLCSILSFGQGKVVLWQFRHGRVTRNDAVLQFTATMLPGWHLYTQFLKDGGPLPTRFVFESGEGYALVGSAEEHGPSVSYFSKIYDTEVTLFTGSVTFLQKIRLFEPCVTINGKVEFMTCNDQVCISDQQSFSVEIKASP